MNKFKVEYPSWDTAHEYGYVVDEKGREWVHTAAYRGAYKQKPSGIYSWSGSKWQKQNDFGGDDDDR